MGSRMGSGKARVSSKYIYIYGRSWHWFTAFSAFSAVPQPQARMVAPDADRCMLSSQLLQRRNKPGLHYQLACSTHQAANNNLALHALPAANNNTHKFHYAPTIRYPKKLSLLCGSRSISVRLWRFFDPTHSEVVQTCGETDSVDK